MFMKARQTRETRDLESLHYHRLLGTQKDRGVHKDSKDQADRKAQVDRKAQGDRKA